MIWVALFIVKVLLIGVLCIVHTGLAVLDAEPPEDSGYDYSQRNESLMLEHAALLEAEKQP